MLLVTVVAQAQINIGGNVYGGGNAGDMKGNTSVTVYAGHIQGDVYGGARQANVEGHAFVHIDGEHMSDDIIINAVYGGNDISGTVGKSLNGSDNVPSELKDVVDNSIASEIGGLNTKQYAAFVRTMKEKVAGSGETQHHIFIGQLYGGGNGNYPESTYSGDVVKPELSKSYLELKGGTFGYVYGGGNNATVTSETDIYINNSSSITTSIKGRDGTTELLTDELKRSMGINTVYYDPAYQFQRVFGGNNKADMSIMPTWHLQAGSIKDLYSGGNEGRMTSEKGLLLEIMAASSILVDDVYGGCRKADVCPENASGENASTVTNLDGYGFPDNLAARVLIRGGDINNVYGGNDVAGKVYFGNAVGVYTTIRGDIYGGGNGSYPYTDNPKLEGDDIYGDFYYNPDEVFEKAGVSAPTDSKFKSVEALNLVRPNAEQVSIRVQGTSDTKTIIHGSIYCGGNSATLKKDVNHTHLKDYPLVELKMGSYVIADEVFLGNNGVNMVDNHVTKDNDNNIIDEGVLQIFRHSVDGSDKMFNSMDLTDNDVFATYMEGAAMDLVPKMSFDNVGTGETYKSMIGSLFCGGNVGSMTYPGLNSMTFNVPVIIYNKIVGGCNNANVNKSSVNARYDGGILGSKAEQAEHGFEELEGGVYTIKNRLALNFEYGLRGGVKMQPMRWNSTNTDLEWNTNKWVTTTDETHKFPYLIPVSPSEGDDSDRRLVGGNVYGGCHNSGHVNGNVTININTDLVVKDEVFAEVDEDGDIIEANRNSGVILDEQGDDVLGSALNVYGAGYGKDSEIWGSVTINLKKGYAFQVFGGGEMGYVGKGADDGNGNKTYSYDKRYSTYINLHGDNAGSADGTDLAEAEYIYGGGMEGDVCGDTHVNLGNGRVYDVLAGACNADILGHTELYVGGDGSYTIASDGTKKYTPKGFPWVRENVYGGNDFGGRMWQKGDYSGFVSQARKEKIHGADDSSWPYEQLESYTYVAYIQGRVDSIFGGNYGQYHYGNELYKKYTYSDNEGSDKSKYGEPRLITDEIYSGLDNVKQFYKPHFENSFVFFQPADNSDNHVGIIFGGSQGNPGEKTNNNSMQELSYILVDDSETSDATRFDKTDIYGAGAFGGVGTLDVPGGGITVIDLFSGRFHNVYGGSNREGLIGYARINVPDVSTIQVNALFGGGKGYEITATDFDPTAFCDTYLTCIDYQGNHSTVEEALYGGNQNCRIACDTYLNIGVPVKSRDGELKPVFGAGYGRKTVSGRTNVWLNAGAEVQRVYGGGSDGNTFNYATLTAWLKRQLAIKLHDDETKINEEDVLAGVVEYAGYLDKFDQFLSENHLSIKLPDPIGTHVNDIRTNPNYHNTNVHILKGASVWADSSNDGGYAYGGGWGENAIVAGTTYIELLGGTVQKDLSGGGWGGPVFDEYMLGPTVFTAGTNVYIEGGTVRNVFGGGYQGIIGHSEMTYTDVANPGAHEAKRTATISNEYPGTTNVVIGVRPDQTAVPVDYGYYNGVPAIQRSIYGGGEEGPVYGTANVTINNGYIGYKYDVAQDDYIKNTDEKTEGDNGLDYNGNVFGGGYGQGASCDFTDVTLWNGEIRGSLFGGGEIAAIGRGEADETINDEGVANKIRELKGLYKAGKTNIEMMNGHVHRNVFGGGRGYNTWWETGRLYTDGYVFGQTEVHIHGGEVGTDENVATEKGGYGNVFGGGDIGYVYSGGYFSPKTTSEWDFGTGSPGNHYYYDNNGELIEDCKVVVSPYLQVKKPGGTTINDNSYDMYDYVSTDDLNTLAKKNKTTGIYEEWTDLFTGDKEHDPNDLVERGVHIHNAVFGGGNVSSNSDKTYANATTVHGNTTATLYDVFHRDFITVGTEHIGGIYGGGNLSLVDGYRELNVTNYGTDYYNNESEITLDEYRALSSRERAYFQLKYKCTSQYTTVDASYDVGNIIPEDEYLKLLQKNAAVKNYFEPWGFCSIYAGRLLNTIQRADLCGIYGSRMVLQGAKDRVADVGEKIDYTINRVGEVSLNQQLSVRSADTGNDANHGNYFGIYSLVNYMGNLTSDVPFGADLQDANGNNVWVDADYNVVDYSSATEEERQHLTKETYYSWKKHRPTSHNRNKGKSSNQVALASGVFLELTMEKTETNPNKEKEYGFITGVVELDLINVKQDQVGGGFVYAKNEHRVPLYYEEKTNVILSPYNHAKTVNGIMLRDEARTYKRYRYYEGQDGPWPGTGVALSGDVANKYQTMVFETSGNFIHPSKRIVDDCYPTNNAYDITSSNFSPAHYWYVKGDVYIYDQKVSAYTGSATAYSKEVHLPLTITAASQGKLQLLNVKPNLYAYYVTDPNDETKKVKIGSVKKNDKVVDKVWVNNDNDGYGLNEVVTWWDWHQMSYDDRQYFVTDTYVNSVACTIDGKDYEIGEYVMDETDFTRFKENKDAEGHALTTQHTVKNSKGEDLVVTDVFRSSNNIGHDTGYVLTLDMNSPDIWNDYYTLIQSDTPETDKIRESTYNKKTDSEQELYREGPTFKPVESGVYGQRQFEEGQITTLAPESNVYASDDEDDQAIVEKAYVATESVTYTYKNVTKTVNAGTAIPETEYNALAGTPAHSSFARAYVCTSTVKLTDEDYLLNGELKTYNEKETLKNTYAQNDAKLSSDIEESLSLAYICSKAGGYGGQRYETDENYSAIKAWCSLPKSDRIGTNSVENFTYNYDALDLLSNSDYLKINTSVPTVTNPSTASTAAAFHSPYTDQIGVEYQAVFHATDTKPSITYSAGTLLDGTPYEGGTLTDGQSISNEIFEAAIRNDKFHYTRVSVAANKTAEDPDIVHLAKENFIYNGVPYGKGQIVDDEVASNNSSMVEDVSFTNTTANSTIVYYCYEDYDNGNKGDKLSEDEYSSLTNDQQYFVIQGKEPTETTTLYVSSESDIRDLTKERIYTVLYRYTYYEEEDDGNFKLANELHVINIHLQLESGAPTIGQLNPPSKVIPGNAVGLKAPEVNPGLYEVLTSGWELFTNEDDALHHRNGVPFTNNSDPVYWYQNGRNWVAFYSKTYLGKTYSNSVPLSVANYHDLKKVMTDPNHLHIDYDPEKLDRDCKIYINDYTTDDPATSMNGLDLLKGLVDLSYGKSDAVTAYGAFNTPEYIRGADNLELILRTNLEQGSSAWTSIASGDNECFSGTLHGDGYAVKGLSSSLIDKLCGQVYNLGVTGSFTGAGVAETGEGYVENCWVTSSAETVDNTKLAVFGNPSDNSDKDGLQIVNCYYLDTNNYSTTEVNPSHPRGLARPMPSKAFYNGEVAYDLNGFYLHKRYYHGTALNTGKAYQYLQVAADGSLPETMTIGYYPSSYAIYPLEISTPTMGYVENRFYDGDYRYAGGYIPNVNDIRMRVEGEEPDVTTTYAPIWPDDYIFFGQALNYDYIDGRTHQNQPSRIIKKSERVDDTADGNRVYRAPAYYRSKDMDVAHFNPYAVFAKTKNGDPNVVAYQGMTAIDFTGTNEVTTYMEGSYKEGVYALMADGAFFPPLLDDDGLSGFRNIDLTHNLLVYTGAVGTNSENMTQTHKTAVVVKNYLQEPEYEEEAGAGTGNYRLVAPQSTVNIHGHWVQEDVAQRDHLLVDKQDFNAPIAYTFGSDYRMWYQRMPDKFVGQLKDNEGNYRSNTGWEGISIPFKAELVTTNVKGEITHFYEKSRSVNTAGTKSGHEYWLRSFKGGHVSGQVFEANFKYPDANSDDGDKNYQNHFLWDYYYSYNSYRDDNEDSYQEDEDDSAFTYYKNDRTFEDYPLLDKAMPYIIGFPGERYYEFDLSGYFVPENTYNWPPERNLSAQTITFVSDKGVGIGVSDYETVKTKNGDEAGVTYDGYTFKPSYMSQTLKSVAEGDNNSPKNYALNIEGNAYTAVTRAANADEGVGNISVEAFRPYFTSVAGTNPARPVTRSIIFSNEDSQMKGVEERGNPTDEAAGTLNIYAKKHKIIVESALTYITDVRIVNTAGITINSFTIEPGETVETRINNAGVYIVQTADARYTKKLAVR